jgi:hypothetical protein
MGISGISQVTTAAMTLNIDPGMTQSESISCTPPDVILSAGWLAAIGSNVQDTHLSVTQSFPNSASQWTITFRNNGATGTINEDVLLYAICTDLTT